MINDVISEYDLLSVNNIRNYLGTTLDHGLTDIVQLTVLDCSHTPLVNIDNYHPPLEFTFPILKAKICEKQAYSIQYYNFKNCDYVKLYYLMGQCDWSCLSNVNNVDESLDNFYNNIRQCVCPSIPQHATNNLNKKYPRWFTKQLIHKLKNFF